MQFKKVFGGAGCSIIGFGTDERAPGQSATRTDDAVRHGATTLFAALNVLERNVISRCTQRHRHEELVCFLNSVKAAVPVSKVAHMVFDNYRPHTFEGSSLTVAPCTLSVRLYHDGPFLAQRR